MGLVGGEVGDGPRALLLPLEVGAFTPPRRGVRHEGAHAALAHEITDEIRVGGDRDEDPAGRPG